MKGATTIKSPNDRYFVSYSYENDEGKLNIDNDVVEVLSGDEFDFREVERKIYRAYDSIRQVTVINWILLVGESKEN